MTPLRHPDSSEARPPDVLVVLTTQWRASALAFAGDPNARTPSLDGLASEGLWLSQAVTPHPFGVFARAAFLTGRRCPANGVRDYFDPLPHHARTLAHAFEDEGYATAFLGKWQLYERDPAAPVVGEEHARVVVPEERRGGFGFWEGFESGFLLNDPLLHGSEMTEPTRFAGYQSDVLVERWRRYQTARARQGAKQPLFSVLSLDAPHPPYSAPAGGIATRDPSQIRLLRGTGQEPSIREQACKELAGYYAHIEATDRALGSLFDYLKETGAWARTLVVLTSVHGDMHGVSGLFRKGWPHEESVRIPLLMKGAGLPAGKESPLLLNLLDLGPTILGLATGIGPVAVARYGFHGQDFSSILRSGGSGPARQEISMPSVPPFAQQCPYVWSAHRDSEKTVVYPELSEPFTLDHPEPVRFEGRRWI